MRHILFALLFSIISLYGKKPDHTDFFSDVILAYNLEFTNETVFEPEIFGVNACSDHDQIKVTGTVHLNNALFSPIGGYEYTPLDQIILIDNDGEDAIIGVFSNYSEGSMVTFGAFSGTISYQGGDGNDVVLIGLPEDSEAPIMNCEAENNVLVNTTEGSCSSLFEIPAIEVSDNISALENITISVTRSDQLSLETPFSSGETILTYIATDEAGNRSEPCELVITVVDQEKPEIICAANINIIASSAQILELEAPNVSDNCSNEILLTSSRSDGSELTIEDEFPIGATTVLWVATDTAGNQESCTQTITIVKPASTENNITSASLTNQVGETSIDLITRTIDITMPIGTDLTSLSPTFSISEGASISPDIALPNDFSQPVTYEVTAENGTVKEWTVNITLVSYEGFELSLASITNTSTCLGSDGSVQIAQTGGALPLTYSWNHDSLISENQADNLTAGSYIVLATDANNCTTEFTFELKDPELPEVTLNAFASVFENDAPFILTGGYPEGGTYSGQGVIDGTFDPSIGLGSYEITYTYVDAATSCENSVIQNIVVNPVIIVTEPANLIDATYLQGASNLEPTGPILRVEQGRREIFMKFDLGTNTGTITDAELQMQVASDPGFGTLEVFLGSHSNWTETNLSSANKPVAIGTALATISGTHALGQTKTWNLDTTSLPSEGVISLIIKHSNGNDVAFASDETPEAPKLTITTNSSNGPVDFDGDGYTDDVDCDDSNPDINPGGAEICDGIDNNCDGLIDDEDSNVNCNVSVDGDGDGYTDDVDCDDSNPDINPGAAEICDGIDNNCDGLIDDEDSNVNCNVSVDGDGDGYTDDVDCDDSNPDINPGAAEVCDGIDNNCDGLIDDADVSVSCGSQEGLADLIDATYLQGASNLEPTGSILRVEQGRREIFMKFDLGTFTGTITNAELQMQVASDPGFGTLEVFLGSHSNWTETNISSANKPLATGTALASISGTHALEQTKTWNLDTTSLPSGGMISLIVKHSNGNDVAFASDETPEAPKLTITTNSSNGPVDFDGDGYTDDVDCDDSNPDINPGGAELCDGIDNNCDGLIDDEDSNVNCNVSVDGDGDGYTDDVDCDDSNPDINPGAAEICDGIDNNCDGLIDDEDSNVNCNVSVDGDGDGYTDDVDCDDSNPDINPGAAEVCDGIDNNCDGLIDDADVSVSCGSQEGLADLIDATYLQGASNPEPTGPILRAEQGRREIFMKFDLGTFTGTITNAELQMQVASDPGFGTLEVFLGSHSNWTETNLSSANKPLATGTALALISGTHALGQTKTWSLDVNSLSSGGMITLIVTHSNGNDVAFASDETPEAPKLTITTNSSSEVSDNLFLRENNGVLNISPNPAQIETTIKPSIETNLVKITVFDQSGRLVQTVEGQSIEVDGNYILNVRSLSEGMYYIKSIDSKGNSYYKMMMIDKE